MLLLLLPAVLCQPQPHLNAPPLQEIYTLAGPKFM
jgi:hypothetical protein